MRFAQAKRLKLAIALFFVSLLLLFQNCSGGFTVVDGLQPMASSLQSAPPPGLTGPELEVLAQRARFESAQKVIQDTCMGCHYPGANVISFQHASENQLIEAGLVVPGSLERSKLIYRLKNYPVTGASRNMPPGDPLSQEQYEVLTTWVLNMPGAGNQNANYFSCVADEAPDRLDARRRTRAQMYNTMHGLLSRAFGSTEATRVLSADPNFFMNRVPADTRAPFSRSDTNFDYVHAKAYFDVADELATFLVGPDKYSAFVTTYISYDRGSCSLSDVQNLSASCQDALVRNFVLRAWGRPIEEDETNMNNELAAFRREFQLAGGGASGVNAVIFKTLTAPQFLFDVNADVTEETGHTYRLSNYAIARRLSFNLMQSAPDEGLLQIVRDQDLNTDAGFLVALNYAGSRMTPMLREFTYEWLKLSGLPNFINQSHPKFQAIAQNVNLNSALRSSMVEELMEFVSYVGLNNRPMSELLTSDVSFARNPDLLRIYGQSQAAPASVNESNAVRFPSGERVGLMTRAGYLLAGGYTERPVMRGVHVREQLLCLELSGMVPADASQTPLPTDDRMTTREKYHAITSGGTCVGCHSQINPVGFALSNYNALGGFQTSELVYDSAGNFVRQLQVDAAIDTADFSTESRQISGPIEFSRFVAGSQDFKRCMSQQFYSFFHGLPQRTRTQNSCSMQRMYQTMEGGGTFADFIRSIALEPRFKLRNLVKE